MLPIIRVGMTEDEIMQGFGKPTEGLSVRRDFPANHVEDASDMNSWSAVDAWRYDFGVRFGYEVRSDLGVNDGFDMSGIERGDVDSQLIIIWKNDVVERAFYRYMDENGPGIVQYGPSIAEPAPEDGPGWPHSQQPEIPPGNDDPSVPSTLPAPNEGKRAIGYSALGTLELIPKHGGDEKIMLLEASSCLGQEADLYYKGNYGLYLHLSNGKVFHIAELAPLEIIQRTDAPIVMQKFDLPGKELFLLVPRYTDCHGLEFYAFGIDRDNGEAAMFTFEQVATVVHEDGTERIERNDWKYWTISPVVEPIIEDGLLIVEGGRGAGQDGATRYTFKPDWMKHRMVLEHKEQIP